MTWKVLQNKLLNGQSLNCHEEDFSWRQKKGKSYKRLFFVNAIFWALKTKFKYRTLFWLLSSIFKWPHKEYFLWHFRCCLLNVTFDCIVFSIILLSFSWLFPLVLVVLPTLNLKGGVGLNFITQSCTLVSREVSLSLDQEKNPELRVTSHLQSSFLRGAINL